MEAHGLSRTLSFAEGERVRWAYPACAAPARDACVGLVAAGQTHFALGGPQMVSHGRVVGHYTFHRGMDGQLMSTADTGLDVTLTRLHPDP